MYNVSLSIMCMDLRPHIALCIMYVGPALGKPQACPGIKYRPTGRRRHHV